MPFGTKWNARRTAPCGAQRRMAEAHTRSQWPRTRCQLIESAERTEARSRTSARGANKMYANAAITRWLGRKFSKSDMVRCGEVGTKAAIANAAAMAIATAAPMATNRMNDSRAHRPLALKA